VLDRLDLEPRGLLRSRDRAFKNLGLTGDEPGDRLIRLMANHPTLVQRPIGISGNRAVVGRPPENLLSLSE
jgi:arsenate reductase